MKHATTSTVNTAKKLCQLSALSLALALVGCGGGGGGDVVDSVAPRPSLGVTGPVVESGQGNDGSTTSVNLNVSEIQLFDDQGLPTRVITADGVLARVKVVDASGNPVNGALVSFNGENIALSNSSNNSVITGPDGIAEARVIPTEANDTGSYSLQATVRANNETALSNTYYYKVQVKGGEQVNTQPVNFNNLELRSRANGQITRVITNDGATVSVRVVDQNGNGIANRLVNFTGENVEFGTSNGAVVTDINGLATTTIMPTQGYDTGSYTLQATTTVQDTTYSSDNYYYTISSDAPTQGELEPVNIQSLGVYDVATGQPIRNITSTGDTEVRVKVVDANGAPIDGALVNFASDGLEFRSSNGNVVTDSEGNATLKLSPANLDDTGSYAITATATYREETAIETYNVTVLPDVPEPGDSIYNVYAATSQSTLFSGTDRMVLTVRVTNRAGGIMRNVPVNLSIKDAGLYGLSFDGDSSQVTDDQGLVIIGIVQNDVGINSQLDHSTVLNIRVDDGLNDVATQTIPIVATGAEVTDIVTSTSVIGGTTNTATISGRLVDGAGIAIDNAIVALAGATDPNPTTTTDSNGRFVFEDVSFDIANANADNRYLLDLIANPNPNDTNVVTQTFEDIALLTQQSDDNITLEFGDSGGNIAVETISPIVVNVPGGVAGETVRLSTTRGTFDNGRSIQDKTLGANGTATFNVSSNTPGIATIETRYKGQLESNLLSFVAITPAKILSQVGTNLLGRGMSTEVTTTVLDKNDAAVPNALVNFTITRDASGGRLSRGLVRTDASGVATVTYTAGNNPTAVERTVISSRVIEVQPPGENTAPIPSNLGPASASLTVQTTATTILFGLSDKLTSDANDVYYFRAGSANVTTNGGLPAVNQQVTMTLRPDFYRKGFYIRNPDEESDILWIPRLNNTANTALEVPDSAYAECPNEDINYNGIIDRELNEDLNNNSMLDRGEDLNGNGVLDLNVNEDLNENNLLDPGFAATILVDGQIVSNNNGVYNLRTDENGNVNFSIRYFKSYAEWMTMKVTAATTVDGSESIQQRPIEFPVEVTDVTPTKIPNKVSPFGRNIGPGCRIVYVAE